MRGSTALVLIIAVVVIGALIVAPSLFGAATDWIRYGLEQDIGEGSSGFLATVYYADGTSKEIVSKAQTPLIPMAVYFEDKQLERIEFRLYAQFGYSGEIQNVYVDAEITLDFPKGESHDRVAYKKFNLPRVPGSSEPFEACIMTIYDFQFERWAPTTGTYTAQVRGDASVSVTWSNGETMELETQDSVSADFTFKIKSDQAGYTVTAVTLTIQAKPMTVIS